MKNKPSRIKEISFNTNTSFYAAIDAFLELLEDKPQPELFLLVKYKETQ